MGQFTCLLKCSFQCLCLTETQEKCHLSSHYLFEMCCINSTDKSSFWQLGHCPHLLPQLFIVGSVSTSCELLPVTDPFFSAWCLVAYTRLIYTPQWLCYVVYILLVVIKFIVLGNSLVCNRRTKRRIQVTRCQNPCVILLCHHFIATIFSIRDSIFQLDTDNKNTGLIINCVTSISHNAFVCHNPLSLSPDPRIW